MSDVDRQQLLERILRRKLALTADGIPRQSVGTVVPLSSAQARLWFLEQLYPGSALHNIAFSCLFPGHLHPGRVRTALDTLIARHQALRLVIQDAGGGAYQEECTARAAIGFFDLSAMAADESTRRLDLLVRNTARTAIALSVAPLFRCTMAHLPCGKTVLVLVFHHIVADGWSIGLLLTDLSALLAGEALAGAPPGALDYEAWRLSRRPQADVDDVGYWRRKLSGAPWLDLPWAARPENARTATGALLRFTLPAATVAALQNIGEQQGATLFAALLAAYKVLLLRLTGQTDIVVGAPYANRADLRTQRIVGFFVNTVPLRSSLANDPTFDDVLRRVAAAVAEAHDHPAFPFERVVDELAAPGTRARNPLIRTLFALQNTEPWRLNVDGAAAEITELDTGTAKFDLTWSLTQTISGIDALLEYASDVFDEAAARNYIDTYLLLLNSLVGNPAAQVSSHRLIRDTQRRLLLDESNRPPAATHTYRTLAAAFERQACHTPDAIALAGEEGRMTYAALNARANQLARYLRRAGVCAGDLVGVCMARGFAMVLSIYAIAKAGAGYVPLDPDLPIDRRGYMLRDSGAAVVLVETQACRSFVPDGAWRVVCLDHEVDPISRERATNLDAADACGDHVAYLLYTSGSTGMPKGVAYPVDASVAFLLWMSARYPIGAGDALLFKTPFGFDVSVWEIFWPLYCGATVVICRPGGHRDPEYLLEIIERYGVTAVNFVPSMLQNFLQVADGGRCESLKWVLCAGEPLSPRLRDDYYAKCRAQLVNLYGPTEAGAVTDHFVNADDVSVTIPIGTPCAGFAIYILDETMEPLPAGVVGELYISAGVGLAHGYHRQAALTAERFVPDPFGGGGERLYRTGDLARVVPDGAIDYVGRRDGQLKLRGFRVELGEIEAVLLTHPSIRACTVLAIGDAEQKSLVAFIVLRPSVAAATPGDVRRHAGRFLPQYMVPARVVAVATIPTTINGKVDRAALLGRLEEAAEEKTEGSCATSDATERQLAEIFSLVLDVPVVDIDKSFFDLGGHSLLVLKLAAACERAFQVRPSVAAIFAAPTVRGLATCLHDSKSRSEHKLIALAASAGKPVLLFVHAASGSVLPYLEVSRHLAGEFSIYGIQAPGLDDDDVVPDAVAKFATSYCAIADSLAASNTLFLAGWSFGGNVAYELGRLLRARGHELAGMILLDSWVPARSAAVKVPAAASVTEHELDILRAAGLVPRGMPATALERVRRVLQCTVTAFRRHVPEHYGARVDLIRSAETLPPVFGAPEEACLSPDRGWSSCVNELSVHTVSGHHFNMLDASHAAEVARTIKHIAQTLHACAPSAGCARAGETPRAKTER